MSYSNIKTYFSIAVNGSFLKDASPTKEFSDYELTDNIDEISDGNLFDTLTDASKAIDDLYRFHKLFFILYRRGELSFEIKAVNKVCWHDIMKGFREI